LYHKISLEGTHPRVFLRLEGTHLSTQYGVFYSGHDVLLRSKAKLYRATRDRKGLLEVFKRLPQADDLLRKPILSRDGGNIGSILSPHDVSLMKTVKLRNKEGSSLLLLRYSILQVAPRTSARTRLS
jgi:hypothetical protein